MRKTAILTSVAGLFLMTAPAFAQDTAPQTPPASTPSPSTPSAQAPAAQPQTLSLTPGATVKGSDGSTLGTLEGARQGASGQELTVRGSDGQLRGVPVAGLSQSGADIVTAWSSAEFSAAPAIAGAPAAGSAPATGPTTPPAPSGPPPAPTDDAAPTATPEPTDPANPPAGEEPTTPTDPEA